jgi:tetratricopeptide (TPR) repeat protein
MSQTPEYLKRINAALALRDIPDFPSALQQLQKAAVLAPDESSVHFLLGLTYLDLNQLSDAERSLKRALDIDPDSLEIRRSLGILYTNIQLKKNLEAISLLYPLFKLDPKNLVVSRALAFAYRREQKNSDAIKVLQETLFETKDSEILLDLINLYDEEGLTNDELNDLLSISTENPSSKVFYTIGNILLQRGDFDKAIDYYQRAISLREDYGLAWGGLTRAHMQLGNLEKALDAVNLGISRIPENADLYRLRGEIEFLHGKNEEGIESYNHAIDIARASGEPHKLGRLLYNRDKHVLSTSGPKKALELLEADLTETNNFLLLIYLKISILLEQQKYQHVIKWYENFDPIQDREPILPSYYHALMGLGEVNKAYKILSQSLENNKDIENEDLINTFEEQGVLLYASGQIASASAVFEQILQIVPNRHRSRNNLGYLHICQHDWDKALDLLEQAQKDGYPDINVLITNRGYVQICKGAFEDAIQLLKEISGKLSQEDIPAYLHIAYCQNQEIRFSQADDYPNRSISIKMAIMANLATAFYLNEQPEKAFSAVRESINADPEDCIGYRVLGCLYFSQNEYKLARRAWNKALRSRKSKNETGVIKSWLAEIPPLELNQSLE